MNKGQFEVSFTTNEGHERAIMCQNADVAFPFISTGLVTDAGNSVLYHARGGNTISDEDGEEEAFIRARGVDWLEMKVSEEILTPGFPRLG